MRKILYNGEELEIHLVKLKDKDISHLKEGESLLFFSKDAKRVIAVEKDLEEKV